MTTALSEICSDYSDDDLAKIVSFLERAAPAAIEATSVVKDSGKVVIYRQKSGEILDASTFTVTPLR